MRGVMVMHVHFLRVSYFFYLFVLIKNAQSFTKVSHSIYRSEGTMKLDHACVHQLDVGSFSYDGTA